MTTDRKEAENAKENLRLNVRGLLLYLSTVSRIQRGQLMEQDCCLRIANEDISRNDGCSNNDMLESYIRSMAIKLAKNVLHHNERCYSLMGRWILTGKIEEDDDCLVELGQLFSKRLWEHIDRDGK